MLTAEHVSARRSGDRLILSGLKPDRRSRAVEIAAGYVASVRALVGRSRSEVEQSLPLLESSPRDRKLSAGLRKLVLDRCVFEQDAPLSPAVLRDEVFERASALRKALGSGERFDRDAVLAEIGARHGVEASAVSSLLYADLRSRERLASFDAIAPEGIVAEYELGQAQAVLLKATSIVADVRCGTPAATRSFFRKLKFLRLLHRIEEVEPGGYRIEIDGPYSLFGPVTKYGLKLALLLPLLRECERYRLSAAVRWGKERLPLTFELEGHATRPSRSPRAALPDEVAQFLARFEGRESPWKAAIAEEIVSLPGIGVCVPDLTFQHGERGVRVHLEVLGYWSRDAVFRRVELAEAGLPEPFLFAVPSRLRVSEAVLEDDLPAALYVYKGVLSVKAIETRLDLLADRVEGRGSAAPRRREKRP